MAPSPESKPPLDWVEVSTIGDLLVRAAGRWPDKEAIIFPEVRRTYAELLAGAERSARSLLGLGVRPGDRVGILMPNCLDFLEVQYACTLLGVPVVPINARYRTVELTHVLRDSEVVAVATSDIIADFVDFAALLAEAAAERPPRLRHLILFGDSSRDGFLDRGDYIAAGEDVPPGDVHRARERVRLRDEAMMVYTSGTTAEPKGCILTHEALVRTGMAAGERWRLTHEDRFWNPLPMFHMSQVFPQLAHMHVGATTMTHTHFDPAAGLRLMEAERCTYAYPTFPTITQTLIHHPDFERTNLSSIRLVNDTGPPETLRIVQERFAPAPVVTLFGMTETCGGVSWSGPDDPLEKRMTTGGLPVRGTEVRIVDPETDVEVPAGTRGEITVRSPGLFERYHNDPEKTAYAMRGGWFHTGDLGKVDEDGRLTYLGRLKDMLKVGGENVAALEIEAYLGTHPAVKIAQVVGVPDQKYIEVPAAFVELAEGGSTSAEELIEYCHGRIAGFKAPRYVRFVQEWPMSASKIQKFRLRERLLAELGLQDGAAPGVARTDSAG
jgi:acyl-CoA synthetase (AMP-forming)/AMP-acid ligase II